MKSDVVSKIVRCAIYTRKSSEEGLDQDFNSLDAQLESAQAFIDSQKHEGWKTLKNRYDDGGFTGANTERPALQRLMADIRRQMQLVHLAPAAVLKILDGTHGGPISVAKLTKKELPTVWTEQGASLS
jgi:Resolvase, N terminal domain